MSLTPQGQWNKFLNLASEWGEKKNKKLRARALCQCIVPGQGERKNCWIKTCQNIFEWCIFGSWFVEGSSGVLLPDAFFVFPVHLLIFMHTILANMCASLAWRIEVQLCAEAYSPHATATIPTTVWLMHGGRFLLPFVSCWKLASLTLKFLVSSS